MDKKNPNHSNEAAAAVVSDNAFEKYQSTVWKHTFFTDFDISLFLVGKHFKLYDKMGAHLCQVDRTRHLLFGIPITFGMTRFGWISERKLTP